MVVWGCRVGVKGLWFVNHESNQILDSKNQKFIKLTFFMDGFLW